MRDILLVSDPTEVTMHSDGTVTFTGPPPSVMRINVDDGPSRETQEAVDLAVSLFQDEGTLWEVTSFPLWEDPIWAVHDLDLERPLHKAWHDDAVDLEPGELLTVVKRELLTGTTKVVVTSLLTRHGLLKTIDWDDWRRARRVRLVQGRFA